jgi:protoporphyrinogen/coproporphyrinogen III oxidase
MKSRPSVVIIGGGISGLATAWWLHKAGISVTVLERGKEFGGTMQTVHDHGWLVETGPNSALETTPLFKTLFSDLRLTDEVVYAGDVGNNRYILREGSLHALPTTPPAFFKSKLWSFPGKLRLLKEPFVGRADEEETIAQFVERRLGKEFLDYAINPFVAGVYAGNPEQLSVRAAFPKLYALEEKYGGLIKGQIQGRRERKQRAEQSKDRARMFAFKNGMQVFPKTLADALGTNAVAGVNVQRIRTIGTRNSVHYEVSGTKKGKPFKLTTQVVITAIPSYSTASLIAPLDATIAESLNTIYYPPVVEVFLGFKLSDIRRPLDGFGFLVPAKERRKILGTIWSSSLFPGRAPQGHAALTTFVGGSRQPELTEENDATIVKTVTAELASIMGVDGPPVFRRIARWERAIPQYNLGHLSIIERIEQFEQRHPGMFLSGNFRRGISVGDCIINSEKTAQRVQSFLKNHQPSD